MVDFSSVISSAVTAAGKKLTGAAGTVASAASIYKDNKMNFSSLMDGIGQARANKLQPSSKPAETADPTAAMNYWVNLMAQMRAQR